ncbi:MAG: hypothetical protein LBT07_01970, partial [Endomicrobium sp.]|nr:hypothetical protein [Endomicrobium sp.]
MDSTEYVFKNAVIDLSNGTSLRKVHFITMTADDNTSLNFSVIIDSTSVTSDALYIDTDTSSIITPTTRLNLGFVCIKDKEYTEDTKRDIRLKVLNGKVEFAENQEMMIVTNKFLYNIIAVSENDESGLVQDIKIETSSASNGDSLNTLNRSEGKRSFFISEVNNKYVYNVNNNLNNMGTGVFNVRGCGPEISILSAFKDKKYSLFKIEGNAVNFTLSDLTVDCAKAADDGSVINTKSNSATINMSNVIFRSNQATSKGGVIYAEAGLIRGNNVNFINNRASSGGAICIAGDSTTLTFNNVNFRNNVATSSGGAIYMAGGELNIYTSSGKTTEFSGNTASGNSNALHLANGAKINFRGSGIVNMYDAITSEGRDAVISIFNNGEFNLECRRAESRISNLNIKGNSIFNLGENTPLIVDNLTMLERSQFNAARGNKLQVFNLNIRGGSRFNLRENTSLIIADNLILSERSQLNAVGNTNLDIAKFNINDHSIVNL